MIATVELSHMRMEDGVRILGEDAGRLSPHRPDQAAVLVANIDPEAVVVARCVGQPACQRLPVPPKAAAAGLRYPCAEAAVAEQMHLGENLCGRGNPGMGRGHHRPARRRLSALLFADSLKWKLPRDPFLEQQFHGPHPTVLAEPAHMDVVVQCIADGRQDHTLVVRHVGADQREGAAFRHALRREVGRLPEAVTADHSEIIQLFEVADRCAGTDGQRQRRGIRRNHKVLRQPATQAELRHSECAIVVMMVRVDRRERGFGDSPWHAELVGIAALGVHSRPLALIDKRAKAAPQQQRWHQVLEHRPVPGDERQAVAQVRDRPSEEEPMLCRDVLLRDREVARQPRLRGKEIVVVRIDPIRTHIVTDVEEASFPVVQQPKVHAKGRGLRSCCDVEETLAQLV